MSDSGSEGGVPLLEAEFDTAASTKKRKRDVESETTKDSKKAAKKLKRKEKKKQKVKEIDEDDLDQELGVNHSFERMDGQLLADYFNARTRLYGKELSSVELEDRSIPGEFLAYSPNSGSDEGSEDYAGQH
jgi:protein CMS1